ncbi:MAG: PrsW family intramembrane metalloprotease [Leptospiraceae bacterium]|nr:PrsW family intramembrane metalloprotease [Leptospiraceae bacterium]
MNKEHFLLAILSILPWGFTVYYFQPTKVVKKFLICPLSLLIGILTTEIILSLHPVLWPEVNFKPKRPSILTQTVHIAFIQAGAMEESFKILGILLLSYFTAFDKKTKQWTKDVILIGAFVALGFSLVENYVYIHKETSQVAIFTMFIGRTVFSSNIHLLINLCFALFVYKSNFKETLREKVIYLFYAFLLAVIQHGIVDFFLLPSSKFGNWLATAFFTGIWVWVARDLRKFIYVYEKVITPPILIENVTQTNQEESISEVQSNGHEQDFHIPISEKILESQTKPESM